MVVEGQGLSFLLSCLGCILVSKTVEHRQLLVARRKFSSELTKTSMLICYLGGLNDERYDTHNLDFSRTDYSKGNSIVR